MSTPILSGSAPTLTVASAKTKLAAFLGINAASTKLANQVPGFLSDILQDVQLRYPHLRRFFVYNAAFTMPATLGAEIDVRRSEGDGGFGWTNCMQILNLTLPGVNDQPLEMLTVNQWRNRSIQAQDSGPPYGVVMIDQFRISFAPTPDQAYAGKGDYMANVPELSQNDQYVDWSRHWDAVMREGMKFYGLQWLHPDNPRAWTVQQTRYETFMDRLISNERTNPVRPSRAVQTRDLRSRRGLVSDRSADIRRWR